MSSGDEDAMFQVPREDSSAVTPEGRIFKPWNEVDHIEQVSSFYEVNLPSPRDLQSCLRVEKRADGLGDLQRRVLKYQADVPVKTWKDAV